MPAAFSHHGIRAMLSHIFLGIKRASERQGVLTKFSRLLGVGSSTPLLRRQRPILHSFDVKQAFLNGGLFEPLFIRLPSGVMHDGAPGAVVPLSHFTTRVTPLFPTEERVRSVRVIQHPLILPSVQEEKTHAPAAKSLDKAPRCCAT